LTIRSSGFGPINAGSREKNTPLNKGSGAHQDQKFRIFPRND
jgi:hypothetical protein